MSTRRRRLGPWTTDMVLGFGSVLSPDSMVPLGMPQCPMGQPQRGLRHLGLVQLG